MDMLCFFFFHSPRIYLVGVVSVFMINIVQCLSEIRNMVQNVCYMYRCLRQSFHKNDPG